MPRHKTIQSSADIAAEIGRLKREQERLVMLEDQRRGAVLREVLSGPAGDHLREILRPLVRGRDASLFDLRARVIAGDVERSSRVG